MKALILAIAASALVAGAAGSSVAQGYDHHDLRDQGGDQGGERGDHRGWQGRDDHYNRHGDHDRGEHRGWGRDYNGPHEWRRGERMGYNDWNGAQRIDYRERHLRRPPYGYEWREYNGRYILAAVATGAIMSIIINGGR